VEEQKTTPAASGAVEPVEQNSESESSPDAIAAQLIPAEVLEQLPPRTRQQLITFMATQLSVSGPAHHPIWNKMTGKEVNRFLDIQEKDMTLTWEDRKEQRKQSRLLFLAVLFAGVSIILILALTNHETILRELVPVGIALAGGFGSGYALGVRNQPPP
jgi:hypothetical protein